jgi:hypothetical protein
MIDHKIDDHAVGERARAIVNQHDDACRVKRGKTGPHRITPVSSSGNDGESGESGEKCRWIGRISWRQDQDYMRDVGVGQEGT